MERIWDTISKPSELKDRKLSDYFDLVFTTLPHKILAPEKFEQEVARLRTRFMDKSSPGYLFKPVYHKRIPADGVALYTETIWVGTLPLLLRVFVHRSLYSGTSTGK